MVPSGLLKFWRVCIQIVLSVQQDTSNSSIKRATISQGKNTFPSQILRLHRGQETFICLSVQINSFPIIFGKQFLAEGQGQHDQSFGPIL